MSKQKVVKLRLGDEGQADRLPALKDDMLLDTLLEAYQSVEFDTVYDFYPKVKELTKELDVSPRQLARLHERLEREHGGDDVYDITVGPFLTALIENSKASKFELNVRQPLHFLGMEMQHNKEIIVIGNLGQNVGAGMKNGSIHVKGSVSELVGAHMSGGSIHVEGNAGESPGFDMRGGKITIDGRIHNPETVGKFHKSGEIWQGSNRIMPRG